MSVKAQGTLNNNLRVSFLKDTVLQEGSALSFNRVTIQNTSSVKTIFGLELNLPEGWTTLLDTRKIFTLEPNQVLELPIRIASPNDALSDQIYAITLILSNPGIEKKVPYTYIARVRANSKWRASLLNPVLKLDRINKETFFQVKISNTGNIMQELVLNLNTSLELTLPKRNNKINLPSNSDTLIRIGIITEPRYLEEFKTQDIGIEITNKDKVQQVFSQKVFSNNTLFRENPSLWYTAPMFIELVSQNFNVKSQQVYYINSSGTLSLEKNRSLSFNFRSNNFYTENTGNNSRYAHIDYLSKHWTFSVGNQTEFSTYLIDGIGGRMEYRSDRGYKLKAMGVKSRLGDANQFSLEQQLPIGKTSNIVNKTLASLDPGNENNSFSNIAEFNKDIGSSGSLTLLGGFGTEIIKIPGFNHKGNGHTAGLRYDYISPKFIVRTTNSLTSRQFPGLERGVKRSSNEIRYVVKRYFGGAVADYSDRAVSTIDSNQFIYLFGGKTSEIGLRGGFIKNRNNITLTTSIVDQLQDSVTNILFRSHKLNINSGFGIFKSVTLSLSANLLNSFAPQNTSLKSVPAINVFGSIQSKGLGLSFRLDKGPLYYAELLAYSKTGLQNKRYQIAPYIERNFLKNNLTTRLELNYAHDIPTNERSYVARMDLNLDLNKHGLSLRFYGNHNFGNMNALNSLNLSIKKDLTAPLIGLQKYRNLKVVLFKDNNSNSVYDLPDEAIPEASIRIGNQNFTTNKKGEAFYQNIKQGDYSIDLGQVNNIQGWIAKNGFKPSVNVSKSQDLYIPFQKSKFLSGHLNLSKDPFSKKEFNASNIRITAISSKGESFSTLTNEDGAFFFNLSDDTYLIQVNTNVFNEDFRVLQETFNVDLTQKDNENIIFEIRERKRLINIRR
ncbi:hypothetical protein WG906_02550 [Pedobacter sp. P351]|uniref:COG1470 family protein n=1 Tax=Pedobacter superstes TaxID=3133441 RepID=UPI0030989591